VASRALALRASRKHAGELDHPAFGVERAPPSGVVAGNPLEVGPREDAPVFQVSDEDGPTDQSMRLGHRQAGGLKVCAHAPEVVDQTTVGARRRGAARFHKSL